MRRTKSRKAVNKALIIAYVNLFSVWATAWPEILMRANAFKCKYDTVYFTLGLTTLQDERSTSIERNPYCDETTWRWNNAIELLNVTIYYSLHKLMGCLWKNFICSVILPQIVDALCFCSTVTWGILYKVSIGFIEWNDIYNRHASEK